MSRTMKNSVIPWIGEIPDSWQLLPAKRVFSGQKRIVGKAVDEYERLALTMQGVIKRNKEDNEGLQPEKFDGYQILRQNELVFKLIDLQNEKTSRVGLSPYTGIVSPAYIIISNTQQDNRFYYYWFLDMYYRLIFNQMGDDGVRSSLNMADVLNIPLPSISPREQKAIADFLDKKCGEIDEMVSLQEKIIEELKAYKQSVITEAVCKGLNPNVPMKDSGIEWIDSIPQHWKEVRFYKINYIRGRLGWKGLKAEEYTETGYPFLSAFNIINDRISWEDLNYINQERYDESPEIKLSVGDILVVKDGAGIGKCARIDSLPLGEATVNSSLAVITPNEQILYSFQYYYMLSTLFQHIIWLLKIGMGVPHLTQENMHDIMETCPPLDEQKAIVAYLDSKCAEIDTLISLKQSKIDALKEYKKSIIYEYITGKKEVIE